MIDWFVNLPCVYQALVATVFTWGVTALGAALVLFLKHINAFFMDAMLGFAGGVMIAASFFSLLSPAAQMAESLSMCVWLTLALGFFGGGILLYLADEIFENISRSLEKKCAECTRKTSRCGFKRCLMLVFSITLHNIPEGMAVGVAFGSLAYGLDGATLGSACMLALGIGLQNFPEGTAVSVPLRREGMSRAKSFFWGQASGIVEPIAGVLGAYLVLSARVVLPYLLAFAAGAMIFVVVKELVPESQRNDKCGIMALFTLLGFTVMMVMDIALG